MLVQVGPEITDQLIPVERFACPNKPGSKVVRSHVLPVGSPKEGWSQVRGQTKYGSKYPMKDRGVRRETLPGGSVGPTSGAARVGCAATWVAVVVTGLGNPCLGSRG